MPDPYNYLPTYKPRPNINAHHGNQVKYTDTQFTEDAEIPR